jgi:hypothetical protein
VRSIFLQKPFTEQLKKNSRKSMSGTQSKIAWVKNCNEVQSCFIFAQKTCAQKNFVFTGGNSGKSVPQHLSKNFNFWILIVITMSIQ